MHLRRIQHYVASTILLAAIFSTACENKGPIVDVSVVTIAISPDPASMLVGTTQQFTAIAKDRSGNVIAITPVWSVVNSGGTTNSSTGLFTAGMTVGTFAGTIQVSGGGVTANATVNVTVGPLATIVVTPNPSVLQFGGTQTFTAVGRDAGGNIVAITPTWSVVSGGGAINAATGQFTAGNASGTFTNTVRASSGTIAGTATVTVLGGAVATIVVTPNPATMGVNATQTFTAVARDAAGNVVTISPTWSVANGGGQINPGTGVFTAGPNDGTFANTVVATSGGVSGSATVNVTGGPLATITVTPNPATMATGASQTFTAVGRDGSGNIVAITPVWSASAQAGTISSAGVFTAGTAAGSFANAITATSGSVSGRASVIVTGGAVRTIIVLPNPATLPAGTSQTFVAVGKDAAGNNVAITPTWTVTNGGGTIEANGTFTAGLVAGTYSNTVTASSGGVSGAATVIVTPGPVVNITVTPNPASLLVGESRQFVATARDANGNLVDISPVWAVVNNGGTITAGGLFTAGAVLGTFLNTVQATSGTVSGNATVVVSSNSAPAPIVDLMSAAPNGIMAGASVTCVNTGIVNADISISPGSTLTGFGPCLVTGVKHLGDGVAAQAQLDLTAAYNTLAGLACLPANNIGTTNIGSTTKAAGVYCSASSIGVTGPLTLDGGGDQNATFVFQAGSTLTTAGSVILINGAQAKNVYWLVGSSATIGVGSQWQGNIIALTTITLNTNASLIGRALARNGSVTLGTGNVIILP